MKSILFSRFSDDLTQPGIPYSMMGGDSDDALLVQKNRTPIPDLKNNNNEAIVLYLCKIGEFTIRNAIYLLSFPQDTSRISSGGYNLRDSFQYRG